MVRWEVTTAGQQGFSQLKLSEKQAKALSSPMAVQSTCKVIVNACQEYEPLHGLATAKLERRASEFALAHPPFSANYRGYWRFTL
jgi:hypothetical protein